MTIYTSTARFDGTARALTEQEMFTKAPSIFARTAHESRSERFAPIPTIEIVRALDKEGFSVVGLQQAVARQKDRQPFTKHLLRLRRLDDGKDYRAGDSVFEILLRNGNDGSSAYNLMAGLFRICCLNSLVAATHDMTERTIRHTGNALDKVVDATYEVLEEREEVMAAQERWSQIKLGERARIGFAKGAHIERFGEEPTTNVKPEQLLIPRRVQDQGHDLWTTFNVAQENALRGGIVSRGNAGGGWRRNTTREVHGIDQNVKVNKGLWAMAEWLAQNPDAAAQ